MSKRNRPPKRDKQEILATLERIEADMEYHKDCVSALEAEQEQAQRELEELDEGDG